MDFLEYLENSGKINKTQKEEIIKQVKNNQSKVGQVIINKNLLPKNELLQQLKSFVESYA